MNLVRENKMMKKTYLFKIIIVSLLLFIFLAPTVFAAELVDPLGGGDIPTLIGSIIKYVLGIVGSIALLMFIYGGFMWLTSGGNPEKIKKGRDVLVWAALGLAIIFLSYTLVGFVIKAFIGPPGGGEEGVCLTGCNSTYDECVDRCKEEFESPRQATGCMFDRCGPEYTTCKDGCGTD